MKKEREGETGRQKYIDTEGGKYREKQPVKDRQTVRDREGT